MSELEINLRTKSYDDLSNIGIRLAQIIERGKEVGASCQAERDKLQVVDRLIREYEHDKA